MCVCVCVCVWHLLLDLSSRLYPLSSLLSPPPPSPSFPLSSWWHTSIVLSLRVMWLSFQCKLIEKTKYHTQNFNLQNTSSYFPSSFLFPPSFPLPSFLPVFFSSFLLLLYFFLFSPVTTWNKCFLYCDSPVLPAENKKKTFFHLWIRDETKMDDGEGLDGDLLKEPFDDALFAPFTYDSPNAPVFPCLSFLQSPSPFLVYVCTTAQHKQHITS